MAGSLAGAHAAPKQQAQQQQGVEQEGLDAASGAAAAGGVKNLGVVGRGSKRINLQPVQVCEWGGGLRVRACERGVAGGDALLVPIHAVFRCWSLQWTPVLCASGAESCPLCRQSPLPSPPPPPKQTNVPAAPATGAGAGEPPAKKKRSLGDLMGGVQVMSGWLVGCGGCGGWGCCWCIAY